MSLNKFVYELKRLNKDSEIRVGIASKDLLADSRIFSSNKADELVLPEGYRKEDNYIVNDSLGFELLVDGLDNIVADHVYPDYNIDEISLEPFDYRNFAIVLQMINPDVEIRMLDEKFLSPLTPNGYICCTESIKDLALPVPYYYNAESHSIDKIGKAGHCTNLIQESEFDEATDIKPEYDFEKVKEEQHYKDWYRMHPQLDPNYKAESKKKKSEVFKQKVKGLLKK